MYLSNIKLWNFRKFGSDSELDLSKPNLNLNLTKGLNVLIGENDSGKSAILDSIKVTLRTHSYEWIRVEPEDFFNDTMRFRIELRFNELSDDEAKNFTEWLGWEGEDENVKPFLRLIYDVSRNQDRIFPSEVKAGLDEEGYSMNAEAREYLKITYLKPLRDAKTELVPKQNSRLSQILQGHEAFSGNEKDHYLFKEFKRFNETIKKYFEGRKNDDTNLDEDQKGKALKEEIDRFIKDFYDKSKETTFGVVPEKLKSILEKLELTIKDELNPGLGTLNRLFMASELVHLNKRNWNGLRLGLIEELEAHLHPQAQMQVIETLQEEKNIQLIVTTHSPNLGSKVKLENLILVSGNDAYPMSSNFTELDEVDYNFLERFLDTTKANLFFAKGIILVEGWSEEILLPTLAMKMKSLGIIENDLTEAGVSVVNVGSTAFLRYAKIFLRKEKPFVDIPVAVITDLDLKPTQYETIKGITKEKTKRKNFCISGFTAEEVERHKSKRIHDQPDQKVKTFISPHWTFEYCLARSCLKKLFYKSVLLALKEQKITQRIRSIENYQRAIDELDTYFNTWTDGENSIAIDIYLKILGEQKVITLCKEQISKPIIAQQFAKQIDEDNSITKESLENDLNLAYLLNAIKYATRSN
jgi:putative ATP-dependent endonuclease of OLD family